MSKQNKSSFFLMLKRMLFGSKHSSPKDIFSEEQIQSPGITVLKTFVSNKIAMFGVICFLILFLSCMILPIFFPIENAYQDVTQMNIAPGFDMLSVPKSLSDNGKQISGGSTFGVGIDKEGYIYEWGRFPNEKLKNIPKDMGKVVQVSAGLDHVLALDEKGQLFTWGNDRFMLGDISLDLLGVTDIKQIMAGYQLSLVLRENGRLYTWGNENLVRVSIPKEVQGNIDKFVSNTGLVIVLTKDGRIVPLSNNTSAFHNIPEEVQGNAVDIALTDRAGAALTSQGRVYTWGSDSYGLLHVPEEIQGRVKELCAGRYHFVALLDDGTLSAWGDTTFGQTDVPSGSSFVSISSGYFQSYGITEKGKVEKWGLKGYLMGTDDFGRDIFRRLLAGGRMTMTIGAISVIISTTIGIFVGGIAGYYGGKVDNLLMRFTEIVSSIPFLPFAIILSAVLGSKITEAQRISLIMVILGILTWPPLARLVRGQVLAEREQEFIIAAKAIGVKEAGIIFRYILPNVITVIIVNATLDFATCMLTESSLSFLGFGVVEPNPTWGNMLNTAKSSKVIGELWWRWVFPSISLGLCTISINCIGDGLRDAIDPKSNER